jgi:excisionase family DNA binding protein
MSTPLAHSIPEACSLTNTGRTSIYKAIKEGELRALNRGRRTLILSEDLRSWLETLPSITVKLPKCECE